jgi:hypothetical protein
VERPEDLAQTNPARRSNPAAVQRHAFGRQAFPIVDFRTRGSSRSVDARPTAGAGARASSDHRVRICQPADATVSPGRPMVPRGLARQGEETSGKRPEPLGKAHRFSGAAQPAHRRSSGRQSQRVVSADSRGFPADPESQVACSRLRPAQQPEQKAADRSRTQGDVFGNGCQREQDDGKTPKRLVVIPVYRMPVHHRSPICSCGNDRTRQMSMSRIIF